MYRALLLEGRHTDRGKVLESPYSRVTLAWFNDGLNVWDVNRYPATGATIKQQDYNYMKMNLFGAHLGVWVPAYILSEKERNMWALMRLIDPALVRGFGDAAEFPPEWFSENVQSTRAGTIGELEAGRKAIGHGH